MTMDLENWLRREASPSLRQDDSSGKTLDSSQAKHLGLPVVLPGEMDAEPSVEEGAGESSGGEFAPDEEKEPASVSSETGSVPSERPERGGDDSLFDEDESLLLGISRPVSGIEEHKETSDRKEPSSDDDGSSSDSEERLQDSSISASRTADDGTTGDPFPSNESRAGAIPGEPAAPEIGSEEEEEHEEDDVATFVIPAQPLYPLQDAPVPPRHSGIPEKTERKIHTRRVLPILLAAAALALGGLFFFSPGESFEEIVHKGEEAYAQSEYDKALAYFAKAVDKDPLRIEGLWGVAQTLESLGRKGEAVDAWYRSLQVAPENAGVYARLGGLLYDLGSLDNAIRNYQESLQLDAENADVHAALGKAFEARGDYGQAVAAYRHALALDDDRPALEEALFAAEKEFRIRETERQERAVMADEQIRIGKAALVSQDFTAAEGHFMRALDLAPELEDAFLGLADARLGRGDIDGAKEVYRNLLAIHPLSERGNEAFRALQPFFDGEGLPTASPAPESSPLLSEVVETPSRTDTEETVKHTVESTLDGESPEAVEEKGPQAEEHVRAVEVSPGDETVEDLSPVVAREPSRPATTPPAEDRIDDAKAVVSAPSEGIPRKVKSPEITPAPKRPRDEPRARTPRAVSVPPSPRRQERRESLYSVAALRKTEEHLLSDSRAFNLSGEYRKAAEKASEALRIQQSPEALSNLGFAHIGLGNYPSAFTAYWRRLLLSPEVRNSALEPPAFLRIPFRDDRWKEMPEPDPRDVPIVLQPAGFFILSGGETSLARVVAGKEHLYEALRLNPSERDVYLNLSLSYLLMRTEGESLISFPLSSVEGVNENALYLALLSHALRIGGDEERSAFFLDAAARRASGEVLRFVRSLERLPASKDTR